jgi:ubiquinone/menaquinone biosynthesis C-methylase UbiE
MFFDDSERKKWQNPEAILKGIGAKSGITFADVGCGNGFFTIPAAKIIGQEGKVYGVDINSRAIDVLRERAIAEGIFNVNLIVGRAEDIIICSQCADVIFFGIVLHDFQDASKVLQNARKIIKNNGRLVNLDWKQEPMDFGPPLNKRFDEATAMSLISKAGFKVESIEDSGLYHYIIVARPVYD